MTILKQSFLFILILCSACSSKPKAASQDGPSFDPKPTYDRLVQRLPRFEDEGWIVSRGTQANIGDSLLFTGLALYALPCDAGKPLEDAFLAQLSAKGELVRYPGDKDALSLDGYLGFFRGVGSRIIHCGEKSLWAGALRHVHLDVLPAGFDFVRLKTLAELGLAGEPSYSLWSFMQLSAATWASADVLSRAACYRAHLALIGLETAEMLGAKMDSTYKSMFCRGTVTADIPTIDYFCGRTDLSPYLAQFKLNQWVYRHQRCAGWESPDGRPGDEQPGVDYLVAYMDRLLKP